MVYWPKRHITILCGIYLICVVDKPVWHEHEYRAERSTSMCSVCVEYDNSLLLWSIIFDSQKLWYILLHYLSQGFQKSTNCMVVNICHQDEFNFDGCSIYLNWNI